MAIGAFLPDVMTRVVNVQWGGDQQWLLGTLPPDTEGFSYDWWNGPYSSKSADGRSWGAITSGASGLGHTVVTDGFIAFGTLTIEDETTGEPIKVSRFMHATRAGVVNLYDGTNTDGSFAWQEVASFEGRIVALSFAHDAFFVTYRDSEDHDFTRLAVTRDGETWTSDINPFPGLSADSGIWNGPVAYNADSKRYATVGAGFVTAGDPSGYGFNTSLFWSSSSDGMSWSGGTTGDAYTGLGAQTNTSHHSSIAAGKGIFVAAAATKHSFPQPDITPETNFVLHRCAVATSTNGDSWTARTLPGAVMGTDDTGSTQGDGLAVAFIKDSKRTDGGYFVAAGYETSSKTGVKPTSKLWTSSDGLDWTLLETKTDIVYGALNCISKRADDPITIIGSP